MVRFLSPEWLTAVGEAASAVTVDAAADVVVEQRVTDDRAGDVAWHLRLHDGRLAVGAGPADRPDVTFRQDRATAVAIATGNLAAREAVLAGRVTVEGDALALVPARQAFEALEAALGPLRDAVEY